MVKELERVGLPTSHVCSIVPISKTVGANRIVPAVAIPYPLGDPDVSPAQEWRIREALVETALQAVEASIDAQTVFEVVRGE
jgi:glycine reductase